MTCSPARLEANRRNAQKSTGPKTEDGKDRSRRNAIKHGLCSSVLVAESPELIQERIDDWFFALKPQNEYQSWLVDKIAVASLRIDRSERIERRLRDRRSLISEVAWDDDNRLEAENLGHEIHTRPAPILEQLRKFTVGCDWLISRWSMLAHAADLKEGNGWTDEQISLAFDLLGTPALFREGRQPGDILDGHGHVIERSGNQADLARREIVGLMARREEVADLDEVDRELTRSDLFDESNPELKKLRRYEGTLHNRLRWYLSEMRYISPHFKPGGEVAERHLTRQGPNPQPAVEEVPIDKLPNKLIREMPWDINAPNPAFDLEPHEIPADGSRANLFKVLLTRQEKREKKAEARREARRRKAEKLRA